MGGVLVLVEPDGGVESSAVALAFGRVIAGGLGELLGAAAIGPVADGADDALPALAGGHGATHVHHVRHPLLDDYSPECWGEALAQLVAHTEPRAVISPATARGTEVMAQAAARADLPLATNCLTVSPDSRAWQLSRIRQGGMLIEDAELTAGVVMMTIAAGAVPPDDAGPTAVSTSGTAQVVSYTPEFDTSFVHSRVVDRSAQESGVSLTTARVVVSGGRGVGGAEGFLPLEELAKLTGGAVGCSRVATNNGWRPHRDQVGQTGSKVNPDLYIACGISGATQHWVGCMGAKHILAVNTDPDAPLVTRATHAVIGDVAEVIPAVVEEIHRRARRT
ncbi:electron transfer flavoprotein subunit alpha/FixB family protein [Phytoactinopolyspora alkaliphila]|uniref:Electron transfer flavoprotein subunit alpha/FixB family protein n=1 Tax=Phytoactinopolyspora alkaliphila TaxID=1783498 RepID=A0A6N9YGT1_9ACTN|nr:electron transfer flavoprotein subunit alpha/FixB family protein [Phytoactinopolyspora alkaliphila]NED94137.1 electron transfer flavoprotein subunit alpha/FixB family protein [Phytoactinopolyspora alkaliphila]